MWERIKGEGVISRFREIDSGIVLELYVLLNCLLIARESEEDFFGLFSPFAVLLTIQEQQGLFILLSRSIVTYWVFSSNHDTYRI